jgi:hypothetical protein
MTSDFHTADWSFPSANSFLAGDIRFTAVQFVSAGAGGTTAQASATINIAFSNAQVVACDPPVAGEAVCIVSKPCTGNGDCTDCSAEICDARHPNCCGLDGVSCRKNSDCCSDYCGNGGFCQPYAPKDCNAADAGTSGGDGGGGTVWCCGDYSTGAEVAGTCRCYQSAPGGSCSLSNCNGYTGCCLGSVSCGCINGRTDCMGDTPVAKCPN